MTDPLGRFRYIYRNMNGSCGELFNGILMAYIRKSYKSQGGSPKSPVITGVKLLNYK